MLPSSHQLPINGPASRDASALAEGFSAFVAAARRLEVTHAGLQEKVVKLQCELLESNDALKASLLRNEQMHRDLRHILDSLPCGVVVRGNDNKIKLINPEALHMLPDSASGSSVQTDAGVKLQEVLSLGDGSEDEKEVCISTPSGKRWLALSNRRLVQGSSELAPESVVIIRDISSQKQLEQEREKARNMVALAELSTMLAHEIRNPLACLELISGLIAKEYTGNSEWMTILLAGIRSLSATVNNVLQFHNPGVRTLSAVPFAATVKNSVEFVRPIAEQKAIRLIFRDDAGTATIYGDENSLQQLVLNLTGNAIRHTPPGGEITVTTTMHLATSAKETVLLEVADTGSGISEGDLSRIFEPGFSGSGTTPGLGLAVCNKIVSQHDAAISLKSELNKGTTFRVEFPCL